MAVTPHLGSLFRDCHNGVCGEVVQKWASTSTKFGSFFPITLKRKWNWNSFLFGMECIKVKLFFFFFIFYFKVTCFQLRERWGESGDVSTHLPKQRSFIPFTPSNNLRRKRQIFSLSCSIIITASPKCQIAWVFPSSQIHTTSVWNVRSSDFLFYPRIFRFKLLSALTQSSPSKKKKKKA